MNDNKKRKKYKSLAVLLVVVLILAALVLRCALSKRPLFFAGYSFFIVSSASMEPEYPVCSLVIIKNVPMEELEVGDTVAYRSDALRGGLAFHRIIRFDEGGFYTKGDNNNREDNQLITKSAYVGKGVAQNYSLGAYINTIQNPLGFILFFVAPIAALVLFIHGLRMVLSKRNKPDEELRR